MEQPINVPSEGKQETIASAQMSDEAVKLFFEPTYVISIIGHYLKGHVYTKEGWIPNPDPEVKPLMNDKGWNQTVSHLMNYVNPINMTTQLPEDRICNMTVEFTRTYGVLLMNNWRTWDVDRRNLRQLLSQLTAFVHMALSKSEKDPKTGMGQGFKGVTMFREESMAMGPEKGKKLLGLI